MTDRSANALAVVAGLTLAVAVVAPLKLADARRVVTLLEHAVEQGDLSPAEAGEIRSAAAMPRAILRPLYDLIEPLEEHDPDAALDIAREWTGIPEPEEGPQR